MLEKDIENLIALYPDDFFPNEKFELLGQQVNLDGKYADIIFKDKHGRKIIVEVKRGILTREASGQIAEYYGLLKQQKPDEIIELVLCANIMPQERRIFLENIGIECKELGISFISYIASKHDYKFGDADKQVDMTVKPLGSSKLIEDNVFLKPTQHSWFFQANPNRYDILNALSDPELENQCWQVNQHKDEIKKGDVALLWMSGKEAGIYAVSEIISDTAVMPDFPAEEKYWVSEADRGKNRLKVTIKIIKKLVNNPILRTELKGMSGLQNLSILRFSQGTNFPISNEEWVIIANEIDEHSRNE
jgi:hypothetical protein